MTVYLHKEFAELDEDEVESGTAYATYAPDGVSSRGGNKKYRYWGYPIGKTLDYQDDFFCRIHFRTPPVLPNDEYIQFAVWELASGAVNICAVQYNRGDLTDGSSIKVIGPASGTDTTSNTDKLAVTTEYYLDLYHNSSSRTLFGEIYKVSDDSLIVGLSVSVTENFRNIDTVGLFSINALGPPFTGQYSGYWYVTKVHINSGTTYESVISGSAEISTVAGSLEIRQPNTDDYTDLTGDTYSCKIEKEMSASDMATLTLMNPNDTILQLLTPNSRIRIRLGFGEPTTHYQFVGYIKANDDYANKVSIEGKDRTFTRPNDIILYGISHKVIPPASAEYEDSQDKEESSEQEDMFKAQKYTEVHNNPDFPYDVGEDLVTVKCFGYLSKMTQEAIMFDEIDNIDNIECYAGADLLIKKMAESDLKFAGGGSSPKRYLGDTKTDWTDMLKFLDSNIMSRLDKDDSLPNKPRRYFYIQNNHGYPSLDIMPYPDIESNPLIIKTIAESEILDIKRGTVKHTVEIIDGYWIEIGDVVYIDSDQLGLRGYYVVSQLTLKFTPSVITTTVYLDAPGRIST